MKIQALHKRLSMPLLLTLISATGIGVSSPAQSTSLLGSQNTAIDANPEATLVAQYMECPTSPPPSHPCWNPEHDRGRPPSVDRDEDDPRNQRSHGPQQQPTAKPSFPIKPLPTKKRAPIVEPPPVVEPSPVENISPTIEPSPQN